MADDSRNADVGARYAQALFELADEGGALSAVEGDLKGFKAASAESVELRRLIASPAFSAEDKGRALLAIADAGGANDTTKKFIGLLAANNRVSALPAIITAFERLAADKRGAVAAEVTSAVELSPEQRSGVAAALRQALGKDPEIDHPRRSLPFSAASRCQAWARASTIRFAEVEARLILNSP